MGLTQSGANVEKFKQNMGLERVNTIEGFIRACEFRSEKIQHRMAEPYKASQARAVWIVDTQVSLKQVNELQKYAKQFGSRIIWTEGAGKTSPGLAALIKGDIAKQKIVEAKNINNPCLSKIEDLAKTGKLFGMTDKADLKNTACDLYMAKKSDEVVIFTTSHHERLTMNNLVSSVNYNYRSVLPQAKI